MPVTIPFVREHEVSYGAVDRVSPLVRRITANNPGPFTYKGTGTYVIGSGEIAVIDPGPADEGHIDALLAATAGETITHIVITHTHGDHSPGAQSLKEHTGASTYGFGPHPALARQAEVTATDEERQEERSDLDFSPDVFLADGDVVEGTGWTLEAIYTPGHISNHLCFALAAEEILFTGDHIMGWSTTVLPAPDGNLADYLASMAKLLPRPETLFVPTHGPAIADPVPLVEALVAHRHERTEQIMSALRAGITKIDDIVPTMYVDLDPKLVKAAGASVYAHLLQLSRDGTVRADGEGRRADFHLA
jgi:glyoxylase-like metal-dependent hydrolase (beta-lactamase superfamily II)